MSNTQLPAEVKIEIDNKAGDYANQMHGYVGDDIHVGYIAGATEYATKLHFSEENNKINLDEIGNLNRLIIEKDNKLHQARTIIEKMNARYGALHHESLANEIKTFLDGTK